MHCREREVVRDVRCGPYRFVEATYPAGCVDPFHHHAFAHVSWVIDGAAVELQPGHQIRRQVAGTVVAQAAHEAHSLCFLAPTRVLTVVMGELDPRIQRRADTAFLNVGRATKRELECLAPRLVEALASLRERPRTPPWLSEVLTSFSWASDLPLRAAATASGVHPAHFARAFKRSIGMRPQAYRRSQRVRRASALLLETDAALAEVALAVGFWDQSHLTVAFRATTGLTPAAYRRAFAHTAYKSSGSGSG